MDKMENIAKLIRSYILTASTEAGSGHPTSSLSATDLMTVLFFGGFFRFDLDNPDHPNNDRLIFSKGHASPLFYALWTVAGKVTEQELMTMRKFGSPLEGHPTASFRYTEAATGSLGQGLSIGVGMALNAKYIDKLSYKTFVLLGDSEMSEGSQWEAIQLAAHYKLDNLIGIIDVNRLGQRGETMYGHDLSAYKKRIASFGWKIIVINGHSIKEIRSAYRRAIRSQGSPLMIIAQTVKGKGVSFLEDRNGWHGKPVVKDDIGKALQEIGTVDISLRAAVSLPEDLYPKGNAPLPVPAEEMKYEKGESFPTRKAYGKALVRLYPQFPDIVVLDAEVSNSTYSEFFKERYPERFFEMYIAEQNMVGAALGFSKRGKIPFVSTFGAFLSRAFDQIRMSQYSDPNIKFAGSHAGVAIGEDGPSQMGLEDIAMFRTVLNSVVLYPSDAVSTEKLVEEALKHHGLVYLRTTRQATPVLYSPSEEFPVGGSKILRRSDKDMATVVAAGITLHEALHAYEALAGEGIFIRIIDLYSIKPIDVSALQEAASQTHAVITVEDHFAEGGLGEAVMSALAQSAIPVYSLAVRKMPKSGKPQELLDYEEISSRYIINTVRKLR
ncbi:MAG: transketolase [Thermodesulfovibrionales bacterium]|nr:transketolase [Thermodesulfovibrionales bacterium]